MAIRLQGGREEVTGRRGSFSAANGANRRFTPAKQGRWREKGPWLRLGACALLAACLLGLKAADSPLLQTAKQAVSYELPIDETLGKLQLVSSMDVLQVFGGGLAFTRPVDAAAQVTAEGGLAYDAAGKKVAASCGGEVYAVAANSVELRHADGSLTRYENLAPSVEQGQTVERGDALGTALGTVMVSRWVNGGQTPLVLADG